MSGGPWTSGSQYFLYSPAGVPLVRLRQFNASDGKIVVQYADGTKTTMQEHNLMFLLGRGWSMRVQYRRGGTIHQLTSQPVVAPPVAAKVRVFENTGRRQATSQTPSITYADHMKRMAANVVAV